MQIVFLPRHDALRPGEIRTESQGAHTGIARSDQIVEFRQRARAGGAVHQVPPPSIGRRVANAGEENKSFRREFCMILMRVSQASIRNLAQTEGS